MTARHDVDSVLSEVFRGLRPHLQFGGGSIQLLDDEGWIRMAAADPVAPPHAMAQRIPLGGSIGGRVILTEQPVYLPDIVADRAVDADGNAVVSDGVRSYFGVPLVAEGRAIGLLQLDSPVPDAWSTEQRRLVVAAATVVAAAIQSARAHASADAARARADQLELRLREARAYALAAVAAARRGERLDLDRQLLRLENLFAPEDVALRMPQQRSETLSVPDVTSRIFSR
ncbi:MAG: GAF domain-containing protein [Frankiales bacterium]|nr:GAF domain-containing protein [Frankiales bacterium]